MDKIGKGEIVSISLSERDWVVCIHLAMDAPENQGCVVRVQGVVTKTPGLFLTGAVARTRPLTTTRGRSERWASAYLRGKWNVTHALTGANVNKFPLSKAVARYLANSLGELGVEWTSVKPVIDDATKSEANHLCARVESFQGYPDEERLDQAGLVAGWRGDEGQGKAGLGQARPGSASHGMVRHGAARLG